MIMPVDPSSQATAAVQKLEPYVPGKPIAELEREYGISSSIKLASNENPLGPAPAAIAALSAATAQLGLYPDGNGFELKQALARKHACGIESITLGNGSNDVLVMIAETFLDQRAEAVYSQYGFAVYPIAVQATGATARVAAALGEDSAMPLGHDLQAMAALVNSATKVVFIANPNNPTGSWVEAVPLQQFIAGVPVNTIVVVDEAYFEYVEGADFPDTSLWLAEFPNLVVTRTFSKAYGLAGLRVGYAVSSPAIASMVNRVRQPFNVNSLALAAAGGALEDREHLRRSVQLNRTGLQQLHDGFRRLEVRSYPSRGNFVLLDCGRPAPPVYQAMLRQGVIVRPLGNYRLPNHLRITVGTPEQNQRMLHALQIALAS
jgi:histidinol-phosphate aminotransferase